MTERPDDPQRFADMVTGPGNVVDRLGIVGITINDDLKKAIARPANSFRRDCGRAHAGSTLLGEGPEPGDVIHAVNTTPITDIAGLKQALRGGPGRGRDRAADRARRRTQLPGDGVGVGKFRISPHGKSRTFQNYRVSLRTESAESAQNYFAVSCCRTGCASNRRRCSATRRNQRSMTTLRQKTLLRSNRLPTFHACCAEAFVRACRGDCVHVAGGNSADRDKASVALAGSHLPLPESHERRSVPIRWQGGYLRRSPDRLGLLHRRSAELRRRVWFGASGRTVHRHGQRCRCWELRPRASAFR